MAQIYSCSADDYDVVVGDPAETRAEIAQALADVINADETNAADFTAVADGATIIIVNRFGDFGFSYTQRFK